MYKKQHATPEWRNYRVPECRSIPVDLIDPLLTSGGDTVVIPEIEEEVIDW